MDIKFSGSDAGGFQFDPNAAPKPKRERKPRKSIGSKGGRIAVNTLVTLLVGAVFFYVQMPAINLHAEEFYGFVLLLCVTYCICALFTSGFQGTGAKGYFTFVKKQCTVPFFVVAALIVFGGKLLLAQPKVRRQWDRFILHAPVVGVLNRKICTARFASTLSNLYGSGVPIITTLAAARDAIGNRWIESQFGDALDSIRAGHSLSEAIAGIDGFEVKLSSSVAVGEETGKLDSLLATISETLDYEAEMATKRLVTLLEPVMIVVMGLVVGGVVAAVIVPIYQSYGTIGASSGAI